MTGDFSGHVDLRAVLHIANEQDAELQSSAHSVKSEDGHQAPGLSRGIAESDPPSAALATDWGHGNAHYWLRDTEAGNQAFVYYNGQILRAPAF